MAKTKNNIQVLNPAQVNSLLRIDQRSARGRRDKVFLSVMIFGGLRIAEACALRVDELEVSTDSVRLNFVGKGGKRRTVTLPVSVSHELLRYLADVEQGETYLFRGRSSNTPLSVRGGYWIAMELAKEAALPSWFHPHTLRHTCATTLMRRTGNLFLVQRFLGHSSPQTTAQCYLAWSTEDSDKAALAMEGAFS